MAIQRYNKAIVAVLWAAVLVAQTLLPGQTPVDGVTEDQVADWVTMATAVIGPILVYAVPNREPGQ